MYPLWSIEASLSLAPAIYPLYCPPRSSLPLSHLSRLACPFPTAKFTSSTISSTFSFWLLPVLRPLITLFSRFPLHLSAPRLARRFFSHPAQASSREFRLFWQPRHRIYPIQHLRRAYKGDSESNKSDNARDFREWTQVGQSPIIANVLISPDKHISLSIDRRSYVMPSNFEEYDDEENI